MENEMEIEGDYWTPESIEEFFADEEMFPKMSEGLGIIQV